MMTIKTILSQFLRLKTTEGKDWLGDAFRHVFNIGDYAEFGVHKGSTARRILDMIPKHSSLYLFDSFNGLPEDWREDFPAGKFKLEEHEIPTFTDDRVELYRGLFKDMIPLYLRNTVYDLAFIHIDCDLYSSARDVLFGLDSRIKTGTIILFHEFWNYPGWEEHEFKAFAEWMIQSGRDYKVLGKYDGEQAIIQVL